MKFISKIILCFLLIVSTQSLSGQERILNFHSDIIIDSTGNIQVTENIKINSEGRAIRRGIYRSLPLKRTDQNGNIQKSKYNILSISLDGRKENFQTQEKDGYCTIYIGDEDSLIAKGEHIYKIVYETSNHISFFDGYDELYWNVTGNDWSFYIDSCSATIYFPNKAKPIRYVCYVGKYGTKGNAYTTSVADNTVTLVASRKLYSNEGFTISASFTEGIIKRPQPPTSIAIFWKTHNEYIVGILGLLVCFLYYVITWFKVGRDPKKHVVVPQFKAPNGWSPAKVRYIYKKKYDDTVLTASIISLAVKKAIKIDFQENVYRLTALNTAKNLSDDEREVFNTLFWRKNSIRVFEKEQYTFSKVEKKLKNVLDEKLNIKDYFLNNIKYIIIGFFLTLVFSIGFLIFNHTINLYDIFSFSSIYFFLMISAVFLRFRKGFFKYILLFFCLIFAILVAVFLFESNVFSFFYIGLMILFFFIYFFLIKSPTSLGSKTKAEIEGFKIYLETTEKDRLNGLVLPIPTTELYEELLPYAIALDVESELSKKFKTILEQTNYNPPWFFSQYPFTHFVHRYSIIQHFSLSISTTTAYANSDGGSGSMGGGFSGGGSGGGGGGGW